MAKNQAIFQLNDLFDDHEEILIYDDRYLKCIVNPKPQAARDFEDENPGIKVKQCPAHLTFRTTTDKQHLTITQFEPEHDHDPSDRTPRLKACKQQVAKNKIRDTVIVNHKQNLDDSVNSSVLNLPDDQQIQSPIITESNAEVLSSLPETADESINIADIAVVCEEDFDILLKNMEINIRSALHKEKQNQKIYRVNQMLNGINNNENNFGVASKVENLSIYLSRSRGRNRGRKNRVIGLPASKRNYSIKSFDELREGQKKKYILKLMFDDEDFIKDIILRIKKLSCQT
ncbi:Protein of unknown function [Cotesia congregata]|uniref:Uncharacterized protein n=1 Tax=Cotesia congregata TaxID=51543 RepID=A0A8J2MPU0_COTCN|nr:Protein of unknown function [Cotesia congregata]